MQVPLRKNDENLDINILFFVNCCEIKVRSKTWAYFIMKSGWLKTSAGTDMEPQNYAYLSTPGLAKSRYISQVNYK